MRESRIRLICKNMNWSNFIIFTDKLTTLLTLNHESEWGWGPKREPVLDEKLWEDYRSLSYTKDEVKYWLIKERIKVIELRPESHTIYLSFEDFKASNYIDYDIKIN